MNSELSFMLLSLLETQTLICLDSQTQICLDSQAHVLLGEPNTTVSCRGGLKNTQKVSNEGMGYSSVVKYLLGKAFSTPSIIKMNIWKRKNERASFYNNHS